MSHRSKWALAIGLACVLGLAAGAILVLHVFDYPIAAGELDGAMRRAKEAGVPLTAADIAPTHGPGGNSSLGLLSMFEQGGSLEPLSRLHAGLLAGDVSVTTADDQLAKATKLINELGRAARRDAFWPSKDWDQGVHLDFPELSQARSAARVLCARAYVRTAAGRHAEAISDLNDARKLGERCREIGLIGVLVGCSIEVISARTTEHCLSMVADSAETLAMYRTRVVETETSFDLKRAMRQESYLTVTTARNLDLLGGSKALTASAGAFSAPPPATSKLRRSGTPPNMVQQAFLARGLQYWTACFEQMERMPGDALGLCEFMDSLAMLVANTKHGMSRQLISLMVPMHSEVGRAVVNATAEYRVLRGLVLAMEARAKGGAFPSSLPAALTDPFDKKPLRYRADKSSVRVWSVGRDKRDNDGVSSRDPAPVGGERKRATDVVASYPPITRPREQRRGTASSAF